LLIRGLEQSVFTAAALSVSRSGKTVHEQYCGSLGFPVTASVGPNSLFDLASLTKILAVTPAWMLMEHREPGVIDCSISRWFPDIPRDKSGITPRHLLAHCSGFPAWRPYYLHGSNSRREMLGRIFSESLEYTTGTQSIYSDLGFMLLAFILERQYGQDFNAFVAENLYEPMGLNDDLVFLPGANNPRAVWTRYSDPPGLVHDLNARSLGGVSGHAGLFGTLRGVTSLASEFLHSLKTTEGLFRNDIIHQFCRPAGLVEGSSRALGFDTPSPEGSSSGEKFSRFSIGHTGFTGVSLWIDIPREIIGVLLTNRVFMGESDLRIKLFRPLVYNTIIEMLD
jgi:CubicO group peptidase (beta-lactamase class C family)